MSTPDTVLSPRSSNGLAIWGCEDCGADASTEVPDGVLPHEVIAVDTALALVREEMLRTIAKRGSGAVLHSEHEGYGVLAEELYVELLPAIHANDVEAQVREAVQVAAVAARWPIDFGDVAS